MSSWHSYPSIYNIGHKALGNLLTHYVNVEEKIDGSQFSFGLVGASPADIEYPSIGGFSLKVRSKGAVMHPDAPESLFKEAVETVKRIAPLLQVGWTYRGEVLKKAKHNSLAYDRVPKDHIIVFDINDSEESYLPYEKKKAECDRIGLECVPILYAGKIEDITTFRTFLDTTSILGGQKIEGVVIKPTLYNVYGLDKKVLMGKFVSEAFKEVHRKSWGESNPTQKDILQRIIDTYTTPARWNKSIIHLREQGKLEDSPRDIGLIVKEVPDDVLKECEAEMKEELFKFAWPHIRRGLTKGLAEHYKEQLLKKAFETQESPILEVSHD